MFALAKDLINGILIRVRGLKRKTSTDRSSASNGDEPLVEPLDSMADTVSEVFSSDEDILAETIDQVADGVSGFAKVTLDETGDEVDTGILNEAISDPAERELEPEIETSFPQQPVVPPTESQDATTPTPTAASASTYGGKTKDELLSRPIPPRRSESVAQPVESQVDAPSIFHTDDDDSDEITVMSESDIDSVYVGKAAYADGSTDQELTQLRLALEASQNELGHLTASRDQALSLVSKHESQVEQLQRRIEESDSRSAAWQQERQSLTDLVGELQGVASHLQTELDAAGELAAATEQKLAKSTSEETVRQIEAQHQSTVDELRAILGQREAAEASLLRERDSLSEVISELQRKIDELHTDLAAARASGDLAETASTPTDESDSFSAESELTDSATEVMARIGELEMQQQQASAELSLANETIRQLNQNLSQRDAQLMNLGHEHELTKSELAALQEARAEQPSHNDQAEVEAEASRDRALADLEAASAELESKKRELDAANRKLESALQAIHGTKEELVAAKESESGLQATLQSLHDKHDVAREEMNAVQNKLSADLEAERIKVADLESLRDQLDDLRNQVNDAATARNALLAEKTTLQSEFEAEKSELVQQIEMLERTLQPAEVDIDADGNHENRATESNEDSQDSTSVTTDEKTTSGIAELESAHDQLEKYAQELQAEKQDLLDRLGASQEEINAKSAEMRRMQERLRVAEEKSTIAEQLQDAYHKSESVVSELAAAMEEKDAELKRLQEEQIDLKQGWACLTDASEAWAAERITLHERLGLDENGEPLEEDREQDDQPSQRPTSQTNEETLAKIQRLQADLQEKDHAFSELHTRFEQLQAMYETADEVSVLQNNAGDATDAIRSERDQAATAAAEASATIATLMSELNELKSTMAEKEAAVEKLGEENHEYRRSVSELHAVANEIEELKLDRAREQQTARQRLHEATTANAELSAELESIRGQSADGDSPQTDVDPQMAEELAAIRKKANALQRENDTKKKEVIELQAQLDATSKDRKEEAKTARDAKQLSSALGESEKKLLEREARLEDLAIELSKSRVELASLRSKLTEQKAVVRALNRGAAPTSRRAMEENGRAKKTARPKKSPRRKSSARSPAKTTVKRVPKRTESTKTKSASTIGQTKRDAKLGQVFTSRPSQIDNLREISGVGPVLEKRLNAAGIYQFKQVKNWTKSIVEYLDEHLALGGRIGRENWVDQARELSKKS